MDDAHKAARRTPPFRLYNDGDVYFTDERVVNPVRFAHVADLHLPPHPPDVWPAKYRHAIDWWDRRFARPHRVLPRILDEAKACGVDFVFFGGDVLDYYHPETAELVVELCCSRGLAFHFLMGNHDWNDDYIRYVTHECDREVRAANGQKLCQHWKMPGLDYSFEHCGIRFVALNSAVAKTDVGYPGFLDAAQVDWFLGQLQYDGPIVVLNHVPFACPTLEYRLFAIWQGAWNCLADDDNTRRIRQAIESCPNVLGVFAAHMHMRSEDPIGDTCQFLAPPGHNGEWRYVTIANTPPPKFTRVPGEPTVDPDGDTH